VGREEETGTERREEDTGERGGESALTRVQASGHALRPRAGNAVSRDKLPSPCSQPLECCSNRHIPRSSEADRMIVSCPPSSIDGYGGQERIHTMMPFLTVESDLNQNKWRSELVYPRIKPITSRTVSVLRQASTARFFLRHPTYLRQSRLWPYQIRGAPRLRRVIVP
jgi:hypothetical protein